MAKRKIKSIQQVATADNKGLGALARHAKLLRTIDGAVKPILPAELRPHIQVANLRGDVLVLMTESAAWAARTRYLSAQILQSCAGICKVPIRQVEIRVSRMPKPDAQESRRYRSLRSSAQASHELNRLRRQLGIED